MHYLVTGLTVQKSMISELVKQLYHYKKLPLAMKKLINDKTSSHKIIKICEQELLKLNDELLVIRQKCDKLISDLQAVHALG